MILKCLSVKSEGGVPKLLKYIFKEQPEFNERVGAYKSHWQYCPRGVKLTQLDIKYLRAEEFDRKLMKDLKNFKGAVHEFISQKLLNQPPQADGKQAKSFVIKNNIRARSIEGYCREFAQNGERRLYTRAGQVEAYHVILSWSPKDAKHLTDNVLKSMANEFIRLRAGNCLVVGTKHVEGTEHIHLHLAVSGTMLNGKSSRISISEMQNIKKQLQEFQVERYPFLSNSLPQHSKTGKGTQKIEKTERLSEKQALLQCLDEVYKTSNSKEHFISQLEALGHPAYFRDGRFQGIRYNNDRKYRIYRLGYDENKLLALDAQKAKEDNALKEISALRNSSKGLTQIKTNTENGKYNELLYMETTDTNTQERKRQLQQELMDKHRTFERSQSSIETDTALQELQSIRDRAAIRETERDMDGAQEPAGSRDADETYMESSSEFPTESSQTDSDTDEADDDAERLEIDDTGDSDDADGADEV